MRTISSDWILRVLRWRSENRGDHLNRLCATRPLSLDGRGWPVGPGEGDRRGWVFASGQVGTLHFLPLPLPSRAATTEPVEQAKPPPPVHFRLRLTKAKLPGRHQADRVLQEHASVDNTEAWHPTPGAPEQCHRPKSVRCPQIFAPAGRETQRPNPESRVQPSTSASSPRRRGPWPVVPRRVHATCS